MAVSMLVDRWGGLVAEVPPLRFLIFNLGRTQLCQHRIVLVAAAGQRNSNEGSGESVLCRPPKRVDIIDGEL